MRLVTLCVLVAVVGGLIRGGRIDGLGESRLQAPWLALTGLGLQAAPLPSSLGELSVPLLLLSFILLLAFAALNLRLPGFALILLGVSLNFLVIGANGGMPVDRGALLRSGQGATLRELRTTGGAKHHLAGEGDVLLVLADEIALGSSLRQVVSVGDLATYAGVMWFVGCSMVQARPRGNRSDRETFTDPLGVG